jgi:hypothetical protein
VSRFLDSIGGVESVLVVVRKETISWSSRTEGTRVTGLEWEVEYVYLGI